MYKVIFPCSEIIKTLYVEKYYGLTYMHRDRGSNHQPSTNLDDRSSTWAAAAPAKSVFHTHNELMIGFENGTA